MKNRSNHMLELLFTVICIVCCAAHVSGQYEEQDFIQYTIKEGLSDNNISCITQDSHGFIWIGTEFGLNRYDGNQFDKYYQGTPAGFLTSSNIHALINFSDDRLAVVTRNGMQVIHTDDFSITQYVIPDSTRFSSRKNYFIDVKELSDGTIATVTATGFYVFDAAAALTYSYDAYRMEDIGNKRIRYGKEIITLPGDHVFVYGVEDLQAVYDIGQKTFDPVSNTALAYGNLSQPTFLGWRAISQISEHEYIFMTRKDTLIYYDHTRDTRMFFQMPAHTKSNLTWESDVFMLDDSTFLVNGGYTGFYTFQFNRRTGEIRFTSELFLPQHKISCFYKDSEGRIWIGTTEGLLKQKSRPAFTRVYHMPLYDFSRMGYTAGFRHGDKLYFSRFSRDTGLVIVNPSTMKIEKTICFFGRNNPWNEVFGMQMYYADTLWLGSNGGLLWFDTKSNHYGSVHDLLQTTSQVKWVFITPAQDDQYAWMCDLLNGHVARYHIPTRRFEIFDRGSQPPLPFSQVKQLCTDSFGDTWISGHSLTRWNQQEQAFDTLITTYGGPNPFEDDIKILRADHAGSLWMHNLGNGLLQYKIESKEWKHYGMKDGFPAEVIQSMSIIRDHTLWMTCQNQLVRFNTETGKIETYDQTDGIPDVKPLSGNMYFDSTTRDLYVFYRDHVVAIPFDYHQDVSSDNELLIHHVSVNNDQAFFFPQQELSLGTKENNLVIHFTLIDFHEGQPYRFSYRIHPEEEWTSLGYQRTLNLTNLAPGSYLLEIAALSKSGVRKTKTLSFSIAPPIWMTSWFILLCVVGVAAGIYLIYKRRIANVQLKANLDKLLSQTEMKALHAQMNPHFIFNSLNSIREMILNNETQEASRFLGNFAHLIRITLDQSRQSFISLRNTMDYLNRYIEMEKIRNPDFHFRMEVDPALDQDETILPPLLIQPFIENAIWHGMNGEENEINILVRFAKKDAQLVCIIEDDGIGIDAALKNKNGKNSGHESVSIANIRKRIELLNRKHDQHGSIAITDKNANGNHESTGTIVRITLPLEINET